MTIITQRITRVNLGPRQYFSNLTMFPLVEENPCPAEFLLLEEALAAGLGRVTEISEGGSVPELKFVNEATRPVLLLDGEELIGAKQNRIINLTILVPPQSTIVIPVSCVEQGRWRSESKDFAAARRTHYASGRSRKTSRVTESMRRSGTRRTNQGEIWEDIEIKLSRMQVNTPTSAAAAIYEQKRHDLDRYREAFTPVANQTGALFAINGRAVGLDLFDSTKPLQNMLPGLVQSYALDAIDQFDGKNCAEAAPAATAESLLGDCAAAAVSNFPAIGLGQDLRLEGTGITGGALAIAERVIHLCAFRPPEDEKSGSRRHRGGGITRASSRRRGYRANPPRIIY